MPSQLTRIDDTEFIPEWDREHGAGSWAAVHGRVARLVYELLAGGVAAHPEMASGRARTLYGVDVMVNSEHQPVLLECTYAPDCTRVCSVNPRFYDQAFGCLFFGECEGFSPLGPSGLIRPAAGTAAPTAEPYDGLD